MDRKGKIASIGIKVSKWTTYHGFSLNIFEDLNGFDLINPCGNSNEEIASVHLLIKRFHLRKLLMKYLMNFQIILITKLLIVNYLNLHQLNLNQEKKYEIDEMVDRGVFNKNKNVIPVTIKGLLPGEPKRPEWMKVKANLGSEYIELKNLITEKKN